MTAFFTWYLLITILGWLALPLSYRLFLKLADRGYSLIRPLGLIISGYFFWLLGSLGFAQNDLGGIFLALAILAGLSAWAPWNQLGKDRAEEPDQTSDTSSLVDWLASHLKYIFTIEMVFLGSFALFAFLRSANPELTSAEKPMELAFINATLRSPTFPPHDPWLSGYAISYYYFGYILTAMLARLSGIPGSLAHNLMTCLVFALAASGSFGILFNLLAPSAESGEASPDAKTQGSSNATRLSFLGPLFLLFVSNLEGLFEVLYRLGLFWPKSNTSGFNFWTWLDMRELTTPPPQPANWMPDRYLWWWRASRVVQDYDLAENFREVIDEFPFFSFLHADLHPHVLAIPFGLLAIGAALNLFLGGWRGTMKLFGTPVHLSMMGFIFLAFLLGGLAFLNTWDILIAATLIIGAYTLARAYTGGWSWKLLEEAVVLGLPLSLTAFFLYLPFYLGFSSQAGGLIPNLISPTRGAHLWIMFGSLLIPILAWLIYLWRGEKNIGSWRVAFLLCLGLVTSLWLLSWLLSLLAQTINPELGRIYLASVGSPDLQTLFQQAGLRRLAFIGSLLTLMAVLMPATAFLLSARDGSSSMDARRVASLDPKRFVLLLIVLGSLLVLLPDFVYLRDQFGTRLNTVFKFYYQAWILWSLAAAFGTAVLLQKLQAGWGKLFRIGLGLLLFAALIYPTLSILTKTNNFQPAYGFSLDDFPRLQRETPNDAAGIQWLQTAPEGVVAEAVGGSYSGFARVATYSGLPTVLGWPGHESQWRGGAAEQGSRREDIQTLYTAPNWSIAEAIIQKYQIRYIFIGSLERSSFVVQEEKFSRHLRVAFKQAGTVIYEAP